MLPPPLPYTCFRYVQKVIVLEIILDFRSDYVRVEEKKRKIRSDKKRDVKPSLPIDLKECVYRLSYITNTPVKNVIESICVSGLASSKVMDYLSNYFRRGFSFGSTVYMGDMSKEPIRHLYKNIEKERVSTRLKDGHGETYDILKRLAYALDCSPALAASFLIEASIRNSDFVDEYMTRHLEEELDQGRVKELKEVLKFINKNNPYKEEYSLHNLISYIMDELKVGATSLGSSVQNWLESIQHKK